jgi:TetR/AcrR family transcriptional repressor for divergent bdcA
LQALVANTITFFSFQEIQVSENVRKRRPRRPFDRQTGVERAQRLFHLRGYDGVSVAELTQALEINPPSLYAAYGSKVGLFEHALRRYAAEHALPVSEIFEGRDLGEAVTMIFVSAAEQYSSDAAARGCLVTEGTRAADPEARAIAAEISAVMVAVIGEEIRKRAPQDGDAIADAVVTMVRGLSAAAYTGMEANRLRAAAEQAAFMFKAGLSASMGTAGARLSGKC